MADQDFKIKVNTANPMSDLLAKINTSYKKPLGELKLLDLTKFNDKAIGHGIYIFFDENNDCLYIGRNTAQTFIERIPWHFAMYKTSWMNHFLKRLKDHKNIETFENAIHIASNCKVLLIIMELNSNISAMEKFLRLKLCPKFNSYKRLSMNNYKDLNLNNGISFLLQDV